MPRLFVTADRLTRRLAQLTGPEVRHLRAMRLRPGSHITVFDDRSNEYDAVVRRIGPRSAELEILATTADLPSPGPPIELISGILKGQRMDVLVEKTTELGVRRIIPVLTDFTVARTRGTESTRQQRWHRIAVSAATQCGRARVPSIETPAAFGEAVHRARADALRVLFWERERGVGLTAIRSTEPAPSRIVVATGPEGGFTTAEVELARKAGFVVSGLGNHTLRAETAAIVGIALCQLLWGELASEAG